MDAPRTSDHSIDPRFLARWSPRAYDARPMTEAQLLQLFEAARWSPSCFNSQPWRFVYGLRGSDDFARLLGLLIPNNQTWAQNASALMVLCSHKPIRLPNGATMQSPSHSFDAGAAWMALALQAVELGMRAHAMAGFDRARAVTELQVPEDCQVEAVIAVGWPGDVASLPEALRAREVPSGREPIAHFVLAGRFPSVTSDAG